MAVLIAKISVKALFYRIRDVGNRKDGATFEQVQGGFH